MVDPIAEGAQHVLAAQSWVHPTIGQHRTLTVAAHQGDDHAGRAGEDLERAAHRGLLELTAEDLARGVVAHRRYVHDLETGVG